MSTQPSVPLGLVNVWITGLRLYYTADWCCVCLHDCHVQSPWAVA